MCSSQRGPAQRGHTAVLWTPWNCRIWNKKCHFSADKTASTVLGSLHINDSHTYITLHKCRSDFLSVTKMCLYTYKRTNWCVFCQQFKMGRDNVMYLKFSRSVHNLTWLNPFSQCSIHASKFLNNKAAVALSKCCLSVGWTVENPISAYSFGRGTSLDAMFWSCDLILINCCIIDFSGAFSRNGDYIIET